PLWLCGVATMPPHECVAPQEPVVVRLDSSGLSEFDAESVLASLQALARQNPGRDLLVDLSGLNYLGSTGLGLFVTLNREVKAAGGRPSLHNVTEPVYEVFALTRLTTVLDVRAA